MSKTLVIGAAFVDVLMDVPKLPTTGEDISGHLRANIVGGSAFNVYGAIKYTRNVNSSATTMEPDRELAC